MICPHCRYEDHEVLCRACCVPFAPGALVLDEQAIERAARALHRERWPASVKTDAESCGRCESIVRVVLAALRNEQEDENG